MSLQGEREELVPHLLLTGQRLMLNVFFSPLTCKKVEVDNVKVFFSHLTVCKFRQLTQIEKVILFGERLG